MVFQVWLTVFSACVSLENAFNEIFFSFQRPPPVLDALGRVISESPPDQWEARYSHVQIDLIASRASK